MNILLHDFGSYIQPDLITYLSEMGHHCKNIVYPIRDFFEDDYFEKYMTAHLKTGRYDCVISTNFQPLLARICYENHTKYLAWSYDSPLLRGFLEYYSYPTSYTFIFDRSEAETLRRLGVTNVFHLPLAVNTKRLSAIPVSRQDRERFSCDVSFVGKFYSSPLKKILSCQDDYTTGYINALTDAQFRISGYNFLEEIIDDALVARLNDALAEKGIVYSTEEGPGLNKMALSITINKQITHNERIILLRLLNDICKVHLYSTEQIGLLKDVPFKGPVSYCSEMPKVFRLSRINLSPTLRSIYSGIPLRTLDIIGSGGFILSNFQPELLDYFRPGIDIAFYESVEDAVEKTKYYLSHEEERIQIQKNSYQIIREQFSYPDRITTMFKTAGL